MAEMGREVRKVFFRSFFVASTNGLSAIFFVTSWPLFCWPRNRSSFYPSV